MRLVKCSLVGAALLLAACSTSPDELKSATATKSQTFNENYQEVFRRVSGAAKRCLMTTVGMNAAVQVDGQLYPDLGYGEVTYSASHYGVPNYYLVVKIEKAPEGAKVTVNSGNNLSAAHQEQSVMRWAAGDSGCY